MSDKQFRPLVYICGDVQGGMEPVREFCRFALEEGMIPVAPHLLFWQFMDGGNPEERNLERFMSIILLGKCSEVWVLGDVIGDMEEEIGVAKRRRQPVRYFDSKFREVEAL